MQDDDDYDATQVIGSFNAPKISVPDATCSQLKVAIKVANPGLIDDTPQGQQMRKLFFNEAHAAGSLNHPNIMKIFDAGVEDGTCYIAMEFLPDVTTPTRKASCTATSSRTTSCSRATAY